MFIHQFSVSLCLFYCIVHCVLQSKIFGTNVSFLVFNVLVFLLVSFFAFLLRCCFYIGVGILFQLLQVSVWLRSFYEYAYHFAFYLLEVSVSAFVR